jgi:hypothetical protein
MSDDANIEIFRPCPEPPVVVDGPDDAWLLCAAVRPDADALQTVMAPSSLSLQPTMRSWPRRTTIRHRWFG